MLRARTIQAKRRANLALDRAGLFCKAPLHFSERQIFKSAIVDAKS